MKARGMLWRRVVDTSQEDRCDRRISTPVPSGLRSHHAFTALWKLLFSTTVTMPAHEIMALYRSRFEIELIFRDAKQFLGSQDVQLRSQQGIEAHWNVVLLTLNLCRLEVLRAAGGGQDLVFSLEDMKRRAYNALLAQVILSNLDLSARFAELEHLPFNPLNFGLKAA